MTRNSWIDYGLCWLYFDIHERFNLAYLIPLIMSSHCFHDFSIAAPAPRVRRTWNLMGTSVRNGQKFLLLFWKKSYFIEKLYVFLLITFLETFFSNFKSNRPNNATVCETRMLKKYLNSWKKYFLVWQFIGNQISIISALFPCFRIFSLFKLIKKVLYLKWNEHH